MLLVEMIILTNHNPGNSSMICVFENTDPDVMWRNDFQTLVNLPDWSCDL